MPLITVDKFVGNIYLPNVATATKAESIALSVSIAKYEPIYLKMIMGLDLYTLYIDGLSDQTQIYEDIRDGATYTDTNGITQEWLGFNTVGFSPIANYIYFYHRRDNATTTMGIGEGRGQSENMAFTTIDSKLVMAWNDMVDMNKKLHGFLYANADIYPEYIYLDGMYGMDYESLFTKINTHGL